MRLLIALRLLNEQHAKSVLASSPNSAQPKGALIDANVTRHHPALKNISFYLADSGNLPETRQGQILRSDAGKQYVEREADFRLYWCEVESDFATDYWYGESHVEVVILKESFAAFVASIRHKSGAQYVEACEDYAQKLRINAPQKLVYALPAQAGDRAAYPKSPINQKPEKPTFSSARLSSRSNLYRPCS